MAAPALLELGLAWTAGLATVASPCVLPMLPLLLGATVGGHGADARTARYRPLVIVLGFVLAFAAAALLFGSSLRVLGLSQQALRQGAIVVLWVFGGLMLWPALYERAMAPLGGLADWASRRGMAPGHWGALGLGLTLGVLWAPCAGPVLASILTLVAAQSQLQQAAALLLAYSLGSAVPMVALAYGGQTLLTRTRALVRHGERIRQGFGVLVIAAATAMHSGWDTTAAAWLSGLVNPSPVLTTHGSVAVRPAPEFAGITHWLNSEPLTLQSLRGKVVLVDFWTYACVNCVRTLPHVARWHARYAAQGLVVVGVHAPEFAFEHDTANVQAAMRRYGIHYPVAQDNALQTWRAYGNQAWPTVYLIDREGRIVFQHEGEGSEIAIEQAIERLLQP